MGTYVRIRIGAELYALPVESVVEVADLGPLSPVPGAGPSVSGVANLRGSILPVHDLAQVLGIESTPSRRFLLVAEEGIRRVGLSVDEVSDVAELAAPSEESDSPLLSGAGIVDNALIGYLDVQALFALLEQERAQ